MYPDQMMFWTQGWLELAGPDAVLNKIQAACVVRHAEVCLAQCANPEPGRSPLPASVDKVTTIKTLAEMLASDRLDGAEHDRAAEYITLTIRKHVGAEFEHVIDPSMDELDKIYNATYSTLPSDWHKLVQRC